MDNYIWLIGALTTVVALGLFGLRYLSKKYVTKYKLADYSFINAKGEKEEKIYSIIHQRDPSLQLSLVVPAYNEEKRIDFMLSTTCEYLEQRKKKDPQFTYEIIVIDDGSKDKNLQTVQRFINKQDPTNSFIKVLPLVNNRGKGFAVKQGMLRARGSTILMLDADAATDIRDLDKLEKKLKEVTDSKTGYGIVVGSRAHMEQQVTVERKWYRNFLMHGFHFAVAVVGGISDIKDTQCGFKLFTRNSARDVFANLHIDRWCFDIDLLRIAKSLRMPIAEVPVNWKDIEGSHLKLTGVISMAIDLFLIRMFYMLGFWTIQKDKVIQ